MKYDCAIIGSGPGGYVAALYASRHALKTCVIEKDLVGGTCLNRGCIPTKSLLHTATLLSRIQTASIFGIEVQAAKVDLAKAMARKELVVTRLRTGIETLFRANKIDLVRGVARMTGPNSIEVEGSQEITASNIIVASGSRVAELPGVASGAADILTSDSILALTTVPQSLTVIGGGVIGCEFACLFSKLGAKVTIVELMDRLIPMQSREASKKLETIFKKSGVDVLTSAKVGSVSNEGGIVIALHDGRKIRSSQALISVGRRANVEGLGLETLGIGCEKGRVVVDAGLRSAVPSVYAIGDCAPGPQLAHKASYDGILAVDNILGKGRVADYTNVPNCIWTDPEIASVGLSEEDAKAACPSAKIGRFPYLASGKAYLDGETEGYVKIIGTPDGSILGVEMMGKGACDLIAEATLARTEKVTIQEWARVVHGHPTLSEVFQEAAHAFCGTAIHSA